ncbi:hypothetical protein FOS14_09715 [Skermania sp. ID1734]|uniref:hypothetical protein n=1 Tax=Skermania sp. ID1734 TaxID=2597516 RepID=UPI00117D1C14|nr:hypothetical protein [Skermania sp. ID1734]TSE00081.1 hypothetical protein FOS14_09715 [Skermania sp. ID1734]
MDVDAAAIRDSRPRELTQAMSSWFYTQPSPAGGDLTGVGFQSRHGDRIHLWAGLRALRRPTRVPNLVPMTETAISRDDPDLVTAMAIHRLTWAT